MKIRCKVDDQPGGQHEGIDYYEGLLSICMSKDPRAFEIQMRYQTTVRRELTQMLAQLERIRRHPLPTGTEPLNLPPVEPGDIIEIPTAASAAAPDPSSSLSPAAPGESGGTAPSPLPAASRTPGSLGSPQAAPPSSSESVAAFQPAESSGDNREIGFVSQSPATAVVAHCADTSVQPGALRIQRAVTTTPVAAEW
ncbi:MAG: hypothetical protein HYZ57_00195 [Acidobacteria bacterium]|nr:hypothetical protein [Acidobacteriota bacterium]